MERKQKFTCGSKANMSENTLEAVNEAQMQKEGTDTHKFDKWKGFWGESLRARQTLIKTDGSVKWKETKCFQMRTQTHISTHAKTFLNLFGGEALTYGWMLMLCVLCFYICALHVEEIYLLCFNGSVQIFDSYN